MHYSTLIAGLAVVSRLVSAAPNGLDESVALARRGDHEGGGKSEGCAGCPPQKDECKTGCLYIECQKCDKANCCKNIGLEVNKPHYLYYDMPLGTEPNLHLNPAAGSRFTYCPWDEQFFDFNRPSNPLGFLGYGDNNELALGKTAVVKQFDVDLSSGSIHHKKGQVKLDPSDSTLFYVCKEWDNVLTVHQGPRQDPSEHCCPVKLFFSTKTDKH